MRTNELLNSSVDDEEVVDETFEVVAVDSAQRAYGLPSIRLHVVEEMHPVFVGIGFEREEADAAARPRRRLQGATRRGSRFHFQVFILR